MKNVFAIFLTLIKLANFAMEPFIVEGNFTNIESYPHSAFLVMFCGRKGDPNRVSACGASILNQRILLTAAHCLEYCSRASDIIIHVGNSNRDEAFAQEAHDFQLHEKYIYGKLMADIALIKTSRPLKLGSKIARVMIPKKPKVYRVAQVAGWGMVDEINRENSVWLKSINQRVWKKAKCLKTVRRMPEGTFCAGELLAPDYVSHGDSGSALVVRKYIQIGLVSYKQKTLSRSLAVYTNVTYYYNWIAKKSKQMYCA